MDWSFNSDFWTAWINKINPQKLSYQWSMIQLSSIIKKCYSAAVSLVLFLTLNFKYCWLTLPAGLCKTPSGTLDTNTMIHGFFSVLQFRLTSGGLGKRQVMLLNVSQFTNVAFFSFPFVFLKCLKLPPNQLITWKLTQNNYLNGRTIRVKKVTFVWWIIYMEVHRTL